MQETLNSAREKVKDQGEICKRAWDGSGCEDLINLGGSLARSTRHT
jgi:hypothetical protein